MFILFNQEVEHSIAKLPRPVRIKKTSCSSRQSFFKPPVKNGVERQDSIEASGGSAKHTHKRKSEINGASSRSQEETRECKDPFK